MMHISKMICSTLFRTYNHPAKAFCLPHRGISSGININFTDIQGQDKTKCPIIIAHGMLGSSKNWTSLAKRINQETGRRIISVDARNHGESPHVATISYREMVLDIVKLYQTLNLSKASIIGHSMGGRTAMGLSLLHKELVENLIVVDVSPVTTPDTVQAVSGMNKYFEGLLEVVLPDSTSASMADVRKSVDTQLTPYVEDPGLRAWLAMNLYQKPDGSPGWRINIQAIYEGFQKDLAFFPSEWSGLKSDVPTLFVGGEKSNYIRKEDIPAIKDQFTASELCYVPNAGHWVHAECPNEFLQIVLKFL